MLTDITPRKYRCGSMLPSCPAIFRLSSGTYVIIGKSVDASDHGISDRVGPGEAAIEIASALIDDAISGDSDVS